jgi:alkyl sulfatase BDS1-like metallo-beta-lactamase superfamily hydrolase
LVFADPTNTSARHLQADALEQLGYQAESSTFRNAYLMGAQELRLGPPAPAPIAVRNRGLLLAMTIEQLFDSLSVRMKSEELGGVSLCVNWHFTDIDEKWILGISNRTLYATPGRHEKSAAATITLTRLTMLDVVTQATTFVDQITAGTISIDGDASALLEIFGKLDTITTGFAIVEP